jgi:hypothetical protein
LHQVVAVGGLLVSEMLVKSGVVGAALCQVIAVHVTKAWAGMVHSLRDIANVSMGARAFCWV